MSSYNPLFAQDQTAWLFEIGQKLRVAYDDIAEPVPPHLTALLKVLEIAATETSQQSASSARFADQQTREGEFAGSNQQGVP
jgi:hypothetical protein